MIVLTTGAVSAIHGRGSGDLLDAILACAAVGTLGLVILVLMIGQPTAHIAIVGVRFHSPTAMANSKPVPP